MPTNHSITRNELRNYFHLPINEVAKRLGVCATVLKKICRKNDIPRWPYRKIRSLEKMIKQLEDSVPRSKEDEERIQQEIATLKSKKAFIIENPTVLAIQTGNPKSITPSNTSNINDNDSVILNLNNNSSIHKYEEFSSISFNLPKKNLLEIEDIILLSIKNMYNEDIVDKIRIKNEN